MSRTQIILAVVLGLVGGVLVAWGLQQAALDDEPQADTSQKELFIKRFACPVTGKHSDACPGWVVNYIKPLCAGGADRMTNLQWQTLATAKRKEREAQKMCAKPKR